MLNADPASYYRLDDPAGATVAANQIPVDDMTTVDPPAGEFGTTPGVSGPVPGVTATGFNGTSSFIPLDGAWCTTPGQESSCKSVPDTGRVVTTGTTQSLGVSVWFKTSSASGVLLGLTSSLPPAQNCAPYCTASVATPLLWIGGNGDLDGYGGLSATLSSPSPVDDGAWHQAVLVPGQALYLDGTEVATGTASFSVSATAYALLGAGLVPNSAFYSSWQYFNGSMADLSLYHNQLPSAGTVAGQYAAETHQAAELNSVTSPAGHTELSATYDTVNDRVASVADAVGGTWNYSSLVTGASTAAYDGAVMADSPLDFWPLNDSSGPLAQDLVGSAASSASPRPPATYADVTLGEPGPDGMPGGTAAGFGGTDSQVSIPGGYFGGTGAESAELWFSTTGSGTLLSSGNGQDGEPMQLFIPSGEKCLEGMIGSTPLNQPVFGYCSGTVTDGKWHQAVLTLSPGTLCPAGSYTCIPGSYSQTATLYVDGKSVATAKITTQPTASATGYVAYLGNGPDGDLAGSIADVSLYATELSPTDISGRYQDLSSQDVPKGVTAPAGPPVNTQTATVTDPDGKAAAYVYAGGALVRSVSVLGGVTYYGYDAATRARTITDPDGDTTYMTYDAHNNVTSTTTCAAVRNCQTSYTSYYENLSNPLDPRNDKPTNSRDARSSSPYDPAYDTVTTYTPSAQIATKSTPPTPACPSGCKTAYTYTAGTEAAVGGGTEPAGLLASVTAPGGGVTSYAYDSAGDLARVTDPLGLVTDYTYDNLGRELTRTQISDTYPAGLTTSYTYDSQDRLLAETDPPVTDRVTGAVHTKVTSYTYDPDGHVLTTTLSDATGGDLARTTTDTYDSHGQLASTTDALGNTTSYTYDGLGDMITQTNPAGVTTTYAYDAAGQLLTITLDGYTGSPSAPITAENLVEQSRAYDPAGRLASVTNVMGTTTGYTYYDDNKLASSYVVCTSCGNGMQDARAYGYDAAGNPVTETAPGGLVIDTAYDADKQATSQTVDPSGVDRVATVGYDADGNTVSESLSGGGVTQNETMTYNAMDELLSRTVDDTGGNLTTTYRRGERGLVIAQTDPAGNTTTIANDEAGSPAVVTGPAVPSQAGNGTPPVTANPVTMTGYDTFGDETEYSDADGNITRYAYDQDGRQTSVTDPSYTPPGASSPVGGTTTVAYNSLGLKTSETDPLGNVTTYGYDQLGDKTSETDPGGGTWTYTYDPAGDQLSVTDATGARTQATYDSLGRLATTTDLIRQNASAAYTTTYAYDDAGSLVSQTSPTGVTVTAAYNAAGERTSVTDGAGNTTGYAYDLDGHLVKTTLPDGTAVAATYDLAGRQTSLSDLATTGTALRTETVGYDPAGNIISATDFRGDTSTFSYDATGELLSQTQPVSSGQSVMVSYGYDLAGHRTALTDGNGNTTYATYNSLGLPEAITEPPTAQYATAADSTTTDIYDGDGNLVAQYLPGGVQVSNTFDANGQLTGQSGSGASAPTASRTFTYDAAGRMTAAATGAVGSPGTFGYQPATSESFVYDDRGLLLSAAGSAGTSAFTYNASGQLASATDAAGTSAYTYDPAGRLATDADAASGVTGTYSYNDLGQVTQIAYGAGNDVQSFGYDSLHRVVSDTVAAASGATVASIGYGYDANGNVTSMTTAGLAVPGGGTGAVTNSYGYDQANRLTSWTATPSGGSAVTRTYGYDGNGNLVSNNGVTQAYDTRNELISNSNGSTYTYTAYGDLASQSGPGTSTYTFTSDAYGQQITDASSSFAWDALDRVVSAGKAGDSSYSATLTYDGLTNQVASDPSAAYSRDPAGQITGVATASGKVVALVDTHGDLSGVFTAAGTSLAGSTTWDPWGQVLASAGPAVQVGFQGQWTDPVTGQVAMGARLYRPGSGGFGNQDAYTGGRGGPAVTDNLHAYAYDNPVSLADPSGHSPSGGGSGGGITAGQVAAAAERAAAAEARAKAAEVAAAGAEAAAQVAAGAAHGAAALARLLNSQARLAAQAASLASQLAAAAFARARAALRQAQYWQAQADAAWAAAAAWARKALTWEVWKIPGYLKNAAIQTGIALVDEAKAGYYFGQYVALEAVAAGLQMLADLAHLSASLLSAAARGATAAATAAARLSAAAAARARALAGYAAAEEALAGQYATQAASLAGEYAGQQARKAAALAKRVVKKIAHTVVRAAKTVARAATTATHAVARAATTAAHAVATAAVSTARYVARHSQVIVQAGLAVAAVGLTVLNAAQLGLDPATDAAEAADVTALAGDLTAETATTAAEDAGTTAEDTVGSSCGLSFTGSTKVLLASGAAMPISQLKPGDKVLATNTKTGKTQAETVSAVLLNHDKDLYDLTVRTARGSAVIHTTSNHPFYDLTRHRWVKAGALKHGDHLRTTGGATVTVAGGRAPADTTGWMWDLTVPGGNDHDFYIDTTIATVLVHNCGPGDLNYSQIRNRIATHVDPLHGFGTPAEGTKFAASVGEDEMLNMVNEVNPANETGVTNPEFGTHEHIIPWEGAGANGENWVRIWMGEGGTLGSMWPIAG